MTAKKVKKPPACAGDAGDVDSIPEPGRSPGGGKQQPAAVFLPGESLGQRSLVGCSPKGCKGSDTTEWLSRLVFSRNFSLICSQYRPQRTEYHGVLFFPKKILWTAYKHLFKNQVLHERSLSVTLQEPYKIPCPGVCQSGLSHGLINANF